MLTCLHFDTLINSLLLCHLLLVTFEWPPPKVVEECLHSFFCELNVRAMCLEFLVV